MLMFIKRFIYAQHPHAFQGQCVQLLEVLSHNEAKTLCFFIITAAVWYFLCDNFHLLIMSDHERQKCILDFFNE